MTTNTELTLVEAEAIDATLQSDWIELSLGDLDLVGGGTPAIVWG